MHPQSMSIAIKVCFEFQKFLMAPPKYTSLTYEFKATQLPTPRPRDENRIRTDISMVWIFLWIWLTHLTQILKPESSWDTNHYILLLAVSEKKISLKMIRNEFFEFWKRSQFKKVLRFIWVVKSNGSYFWPSSLCHEPVIVMKFEFCAHLARLLRKLDHVSLGLFSRL